MAWLPDGEKFLKICLFVLTQLMNVTDRRTDTHTNNACRHIPRLCIALRGKNYLISAGYCIQHVWVSWKKDVAWCTECVHSCGDVFELEQSQSDPVSLPLSCYCMCTCTLCSEKEKP